MAAFDQNRKYAKSVTIYTFGGKTETEIRSVFSVKHEPNQHELSWVEQGLTSHSTQYRSFGDDIFTGHVTQPTVSKHWRRMVSMNSVAVMYFSTILTTITYIYISFSHELTNNIMTIN